MRCTLVLALSLCAVFGGCNSGGENASESAATTGGSQIASGRFQGKVVETMDAGGYTYAHLQSGNESIWTAGPVTKLAVGDQAAVSLDMPMKDFHSEALDRDFDTVYFTGSIETGAAATMRDEVAGKGTGTEHTKVAPMDVDTASLGEADGGISVADLWAKRKQFAGDKVTLRGRVVKFNAGIMGRNWLHLQDGTGDSDQQTHDLTVTTDARVAVGDVVTVSGMVSLDQDFGAGYKYALLVEKADVKVEKAAATGESR